ncbi:hypothetical protein PsorP6_015331 [Peronosclerospora sorghi]|uniref:Uncharacterized protein n=1 Tax=Peronosclerospora sorghi TaxID=230839 RepID=A0ACC0VSZ0_9STRA|nr:hypothetical protein PsorP6_015331 [Peronosclerospora sorghi]
MENQQRRRYTSKEFKDLCRRLGIVHQKTAAYLINRTCTRTRPDLTPDEIVFGGRPNLSHLRLFGSMGYAHIDWSQRTKLDAKCFQCMILGYADDTKGYRVLNLENGKMVVSRSVRLD